MLVSLAFKGEIIEWRGPAPFLFVPIPESKVAEIKYASHEASYGWGVVPVEAQIEGVDFTTSLFPRGGGYLLPVKVAVQKSAQVGLGDRVSVSVRVVAR